jgi:hypothetical protein
MRKQEQNSKKNRKNVEKDASTAAQKSPVTSKVKNLSLIFSKLAEFEDRRSDEDFFHLLGDEVDPNFSIQNVNLPEELAKLTAVFENNESGAERLGRLKVVFAEKLGALKELEASIPSALVTCRAAYKKKDLMIMDSLRLRQDIDASEASYKEKAELCRNLQAKNKEYEASSQLLLVEEAKNTEELRAKCLNSVTSIVKQIEDEEAAVVAKKEENDSLAEKIREFNSHLVLRDEHLATQRKARAIEQQLLDAKKVQYLRGEEQRCLNSKSYQNHFQQLKEAEKDLERQLGLYVEKASSFEATLDDTKSVFQQFEDRADLMMREVDEIEQEIQKQDLVKLEKELKLEKIQRCITSANVKLEEMILDHTLADKCRLLQARRTALTKELALVSPPLAVAVENLAVEGVPAAPKGIVNVPAIKEDLLDDRPSEEVVDSRSGKSSPPSDSSWVPSVHSSSSRRQCSTPPSSSSRVWTEFASGENAAGEDTPVSSPSINSPKRIPKENASVDPKV